MRGVCEKVLQHWAGFKYVQKNLNKPWGARMLWVVPPSFAVHGKCHFNTAAGKFA
jgi:hypothetical protein